MHSLSITIPKGIHAVSKQLKSAGFEAFIVGGCVRDVLRGAEPKDWDVTTNATPQQIQNVFTHTLYNNRFGTVIVREGGLEIEVTPYRAEAQYTDARHPDEVRFGVSLEEDLARRDFTINAMAMDVDDTKIIDPFDGQKDLQAKLVRAVGDPLERFTEDALRLLRAMRFTAELDFHIEKKTWEALKKYAPAIQKVSGERVRDEIMKMVASDNPLRGFLNMLETGMMEVVFPELIEGRGVMQNKHHIYSVLFHNLLALQYCPTDDVLVRFAALFHDVGKPRTKQGDGIDSTFHAHDIVGSRMVYRIMKRLRFGNDEIRKVTHLVRFHMFYYSIGEVTDAGVRRMVKRLGVENIEDFIALRIGDRMGSGTQVEMPKRLRILIEHMRDVQRDPITVQSLALRGDDLIKQLGLKPGPIVGALQEALLEEVLDDPKKNTPEFLLEKARAWNHEELLKEYIERRKKNRERAEELFHEGVDAANFMDLTGGESQEEECC